MRSVNFNIDPLGYWRNNDTPDRQGITEIRHVEAYEAFWDELRRRHPGMLIDTCASGGRRNNLETLRRSIPILRSDDQMQPINEQCHTYGLAMWVPINGSGVYMNSDYVVRSCMSSIFGIAADVRQKVDWDSVRRLMNQWQELASCMLGDYYPLTPYSQANTAWMAFQWDLPDQKKGMIEAFRREQSADGSITVKLSGLDSRAKYRLTNLDKKAVQVFSGSQLATGIPIVIDTKPGSVLIRYERL